MLILFGLFPPKSSESNFIGNLIGILTESRERVKYDMFLKKIVCEKATEVRTLDSVRQPDRRLAVKKIQPVMCRSQSYS